MSGIFFCHDFTKNSINDLLTYNTSPDETAAILLEPVQGEAGIIDIPMILYNMSQIYVINIILCLLRMKYNVGQGELEHGGI